MRDIKSNVDIAQSIAPSARTASVNGSGVDLRGYDSAMAEVASGAITDGSFTPKLQESDDDSSYSDVATADLEGSFAACSANAIQRVGYKGSKRYIRIVLTEAGASPAPSTGGLFAGSIIRGHAHGKPLA